MTGIMDWQGEAGHSWAELYPLTDRSFAGLTQQLLDRLERLPGHDILDIGCGAGELSLALARLRPRARVIGVDVSAELVNAARARSGERTLVEFAEGDAATWTRAGFAPDLLVSRHGVMFFDDPVRAFGHLHGMAAPGARLAFTCFRDRRLNPWASELGALLPAEVVGPADPLAPGPFAFADIARVEEVLYAAGWQDLEFEPIDYAFVAGLGPDPVNEAGAFFARIGPAAAPLRQMAGSPGRLPLLGRIEAWLQANRSGDTVAFRAAAWYVTARRD